MKAIRTQATRAGLRTRRRITRARRRASAVLLARPAVGRSVIVVAVAILVTSQIVDWLEPAFGLSLTSVLIAADIAVLLVSGCAVLVEMGALPALGRLWRRISGNGSRFVNGLYAFSLTLLVLIAIAHQHHDPRLDAYLAVIGAVLLPVGGLLATQHRGSRR